jgi:hypothetical protein
MAIKAITATIPRPTSMMRTPLLEPCRYTSLIPYCKFAMTKELSRGCNSGRLLAVDLGRRIRTPSRACAPFRLPNVLLWSSVRSRRAFPIAISAGLFYARGELAPASRTSRRRRIIRDNVLVHNVKILVQRPEALCSARRAASRYLQFQNDY